MPRITVEWDKGSFCTDCTQIATMFMHAPETFCPQARGLISDAMRHALHALLAESDKAVSYGKSEKKIDLVRITVERKKPAMP